MPRKSYVERMKVTPLATAVGAASITALVCGIAPLRADVPRAKDDGPKLVLPPRRAAPAALDSAKRAVKLTNALKAVGAANLVAPPALEMRVTPIVPRHPSGAELYGGGPLYFNGPASGEPDGSYHRNTRKGGGLSITGVQMKFPTEKNKFYVVDCRVNPPSGPAIRYSLGKPGGSAQLPVEDGHLTTAFLANGPQADLSLMFFPAEGSTSDDLGEFYGCDVGKV
jgi:hypothetical protein